MGRRTKNKTNRSQQPERQQPATKNGILSPVSFVLDYRAMFQANNDIHTLGDCKTGCYSYDVWLWRAPIVVTVDTSANWDQQEPWIYENSKYVFLEGPSWIEQI